MDSKMINQLQMMGMVLLKSINQWIKKILMKLQLAPTLPRKTRTKLQAVDSTDDQSNIVNSWADENNADGETNSEQANATGSESDSAPNDSELAGQEASESDEQVTFSSQNDSW
jgi:hypothetical protein